MTTDIATWLERRRVHLSPIPRTDIVGVGHAVEALEGDHLVHALGEAGLIAMTDDSEADHAPA